MTYIKWKDEVESYLGNLSESEKQKVFSYFAEMYADKRDAGISEESIIEGFGAPYDVAKRILADSKESQAAQSENSSGAVNGCGGNNYNYNYYNYNYGGAPAGFNPSAENAERQRAETDGKSAFGSGYMPPNPDDIDVSDIDMPLPEGTPKPKVKRESSRHPFIAFLLIVLLAIPMFVVFCVGVGLTVGLFSSAIGCIVSGCAAMGDGIGGLVAGLGKSEIAVLGSGLMQFGVGLILIPVSVYVVKFIWKIVVWVFKQVKSLIAA